MEINPFQDLTNNNNNNNNITNWARDLENLSASIALQLPFSQLYIALTFMILSSCIIIIIGTRRALQDTRSDFSGDDLEHISIVEAASFPITASITLFTLYVVLKYIPSEYISMIVSFYISLFSIFAVNMVLRSVIGTVEKSKDDNNNNNNNNTNTK
eukprot:Tbor_TRINITY_DN5563_c2_g2::TRINITY_DN5563_c2_g2_i9::g.13223::m.13223